MFQGTKNRRFQAVTRQETLSFEEPLSDIAFVVADVVLVLANVLTKMFL